MTSDWAQLAYLLAAGAVVLLGARWELRQVHWGETAWRVMLVLLVLAAVGGAAMLMWRETRPAPPNVPPPSSEDALAV